MHLYVIRHSDPLSGADGLTERGYREAETVAARLKRIGVTHLYSSDLRRAEETARISSEATGLPVTVHRWLREPGGLSIEQDGRRYMMWDTYGESVRRSMPPPSYTDWYNREPFSHPQVKRTWATFTTNADGFITTHGYVRDGGRYRVARATDDRIAVFAHNGTVLLFIAHLLMIPLPLVWCGFYSWPSGITDFLFETHSPDWAVPRATYVADTSHLAAADLEPQPRGMGDWFEQLR